MTLSPQNVQALNFSHQSLTRMRQRVVTASDIEVLASKGYRLKYKLGEGSYAKVYYAEPLSEEKFAVACKIINTTSAPNEYANKFLPRELTIITRLSHPNIIFIHFILRRGPRLFVFMRWAEQGDLLDYILNNGPLTEEHSRFWFHQLMEAIQYLHYLNIAHRDIKCENILITTNNNLKLADFGFSRVTTDYAGKQIKSSTYCGSLSYAPPEILRTKQYYPMPADIWAAGIVFYIMLNKSLPFTATKAKYIVQLQMEKKWKMKSRPGVVFSPEVIDLLTNILEPDSVLRFTADRILAHGWFLLNPFFQTLSESQQAAMSRSEKLRVELRQQLGRKMTGGSLRKSGAPQISSKLSEVKSENVFSAVQSKVRTNQPPSPNDGARRGEQQEIERQGSALNIQESPIRPNNNQNNVSQVNPEVDNRRKSRDKTGRKSGNGKSKGKP